MTAPAHVTVTCPAGPVTGLDDGTVRRFHSIPYSKIPGDFLDAVRAAPATIDATIPRPRDIALSVTTPADARPDDDLPVIVYIHGGRFEYGTHEDPRADGRANALQGVITVQLGYRVGLPGFARFHDDEPHRYRGVDDCQLGLEWVQRNIEAFGGDPTNVTLTGQSAGATTALWLMRRDHYRGAFRRVLAMSPCYPRASFEDRRGSLRRALGKPVTREALSAMKPDALTRGYRRFRTRHGLDMALGPSPFDGTQLAEVPLVLSCMRDEFYHMPIGVRIDRSPFAERAVRMLARPMGVTGSIDSWLAAAKKINPERLAGRLIGDSANRRWVSQAGDEAPGPTWVTEFTTDHGPALHCAEIPHLFGAQGTRKGGPMHAWLTDFAHGVAPDWNQYRPGGGRPVRRVNMESDTVSVVNDGLRMVREAFHP